MVVQNTSKRDVKSKTNSILGLLQNKNTQNYVNVIGTITLAVLTIGGAFQLMGYLFNKYK